MPSAWGQRDHPARGRRGGEQQCLGEPSGHRRMGGWRQHDRIQQRRHSHDFERREGPGVGHRYDGRGHPCHGRRQHNSEQGADLRPQRARHLVPGPDDNCTHSIHNEGVIEAGNGTTSNVIGNSGSGDVVFVNDVGASVHGSLIFGAGDDTLGLYAGSTISGNVNGGGGTNNMILLGEPSSNDILTGAITNFQSLTKIERASGL